MKNKHKYTSKNTKKTNNYVKQVPIVNDIQVNAHEQANAHEQVNAHEQASENLFVISSNQDAADAFNLSDLDMGKPSLQNHSQHGEIDCQIPPRFILDEHLGTGGVCEVFKALDLRRVEWGDTNPYVAIKRLIPELVNDPKARACLIQEFYTVRHLSHQGIIRFFDIHKEPWGMCCSMELLQGLTLKDYIIDNPLGKGKSAYNIILNLLYIVDFIHSNNIAHGDIKPANIFLEAKDKIVLFDFNVASVGDKDGDNSAFVKRIFQSENPHAHCSRYSSPEQSLTGIVSSKADIFSVACCIYELFHGSYPFESSGYKLPVNYSNFPKKPHYMPYYQWYILKLAMDYEPKKRPDIKIMIKVFQQPFGFLFVFLYFCKNSISNANKFVLEIVTKLKKLLRKD